MPTIVRDNERSWAIEIISEINHLCANNGWKIKRAGGERTVSLNRTSMFPDVMLFGDNGRNFLLQGWELKMPDVLIEDYTFIKDAQRKALALNLNSCLIWNFTYAVLYIKKDDNSFEKAKVWNSTSHIRTREDVATYENDWKGLLEEILCYINGFFVTGKISSCSIGATLSDSILSELIKRNKELVSDHIRLSSNSDVSLGAHITLWWLNVRNEYIRDEANEYDAFAKTIILNWAIRILFAHVIKTRQNNAILIDAFNENMTPNQLNSIFSTITSRCDFYNIFAPILGDEFIPDSAWRDLVDFSHFIKSNAINGIDQTTFQNILEETVSHSRREINGQYTTPEILAEILVRLTITDWNGDVLDCCCGTGTIPQKILSIKKKKIGIEKAVKQVWASDKYSYPLQVANISMASSDSINMANRIFQYNALSLEPGTSVYITDPMTGVKNRITVPKFHAVISNLPFIHFENIPDDDRVLFRNNPDYESIDGRSDLFAYIALHIEKLLNDNGRAGIIVSNSWLASNGGNLFNVLSKKYHISQIHISGSGRWFKNADIVTTILVLDKKIADQENEHTSFIVWHRSLEELIDSEDVKEKLINGSILNKDNFNDIYSLSKYSGNEINKIKDLHVSYNALFHNVDWLLQIQNKLAPITDYFQVFRGSRRDWDKFFYPKDDHHRIEEKYLLPVLINARKVDSLVTVANEKAFCCDRTIQELENSGDVGALNWIRTFESQKNGVGIPLPIVLAKPNVFWYQLQRNEIAELFTMMNPDKRFFYGRLAEPSFVNQRLIGLKRVDKTLDLDILHALLNSVISYFYIEANGFGRGLGVLDINKDNIENSLMLNPSLLNDECKKKIVEKFEVIKQRKIVDIEQELLREDRIDFEKIVFQSFGIIEHLDSVIASLKSLLQVRKAVKN